MIWLVLGGFLGVLSIAHLRVVAPTQAGVVERLGRYHRLLEPGLHALVPGVDRLRAVPGLSRFGIIECREATLAFDFPLLANTQLSGHLWFCVDDVAAAAYAPQPLLEHLSLSAQGQLSRLLLAAPTTPTDQLLAQWQSGLRPIWAPWGVRLVRITLIGGVGQPSCAKVLAREAHKSG